MTELDIRGYYRVYLEQLRRQMALLKDLVDSFPNYLIGRKQIIATVCSDGVIVQHRHASNDSMIVEMSRERMQAAVFKLFPTGVGVAASFERPGGRQIFGVSHLERGDGTTWDSPWVILELIDGLSASSWSTQLATATGAQDALYAVTQRLHGNEPGPSVPEPPNAELERVRSALVTLDRKLLERLDGAIARARSGGPDSLSQGANSLHEVIDHLLRMQAPEARCLAWSKQNFTQGVRPGDKLTRSARVHFIIALSGRAPETAVRLAKAVGELSAQLQGSKHGDKFSDPTRVDQLVRLTSAWIAELLDV